MDKRNIFTKAVIALLILMFLGGIALGAAEVLSAEGQDPPKEIYRESMTPLPKNKTEIIDYLNRCEDFAVSEQVKLDVNTAAEIDNNSISFGENGDLLVKSLIYAKDSILSNVAKQYPAISVDFGKNISEKLWNLNFDQSLISGVRSQEDGENYTFKIIFPDEANPFDTFGIVNNSFRMSDSRAILQYLRESYKEFAVIANTKVICTGLEIDATVNKFTNKISNVTYIKIFKVETDVTFSGELSDIGKKHFYFTFAEKTSFNLTWANLTLTPRKLEIKEGDIKVISAHITASGDIKAIWSSSNPEIASVDTDGYIKGLEVSPKPVIITAMFDFLGKTYSDTCEVFVKVPVKEVHLTAKKLTLSTGETKILTASVKPKDATIKDVLWYSSDPSIAVVDENGKVTGVKKGKTDIIVLSKDGYYKISCAVTVTD